MCKYCYISLLGILFEENTLETLECMYMNTFTWGQTDFEENKNARILKFLSYVVHVLAV